jgi:hypothetical protein
MKVWHIHIAGWIPKATNTHSEYVILIAFTLTQWLGERACMLRLYYIACLSLGSPVPWPRGLRCRSAAARLLRLWVPIPPEAWMIVCCECCVLSGRGLRERLITRPNESC